MTAKVIATILNRHQKIFIYEHNGQKYTGRMWVIEPPEKDYKHIPEEIWNKEVMTIIEYDDKLVIDVEV